MEKKESTKLNNLLCQLVQDTRDDVRPLIFEDMLEITKLFEDHLNTQPQAEEKSTFEDGVDFKEEVIKMKHKFEDTPEEWPEEWAEKLWELIDVYRDSKDINSELEGIEEVNQYVKQLLDEREREVLNSMREWVVEYHKDNWDIRDFDAEIAIGKIIDRELSKLTTK